MAPLAIFEGNTLPPDLRMLHHIAHHTSSWAASPPPPPPLNITHSNWDSSKSSALYKVDGWGAPYFFVNAQGDMAVRPHGNHTKPKDELSIMKILKHLLQPRSKGGLGLSTPAILRFPDILRDRLHTLQFSFNNAIKAMNFQGCFQGVFPVKCNQDHSVVENIIQFGKHYAFGLEAGSKPELLLAMAALSKGNPDALLVCNGYKDADYICLALVARFIGINCVIVLEQEEELDQVLNMSKKLCIEPVIGLRAKLNTKHTGHFGDTSGEKGKFGLSCSEIVVILNKLHAAKKLGCLQLLHFHIGSQIPSLVTLNDGVSEATHIYGELALMGANMRFLDIGGGLGIDYDGTNSPDSDLSVGYTMESYALEVVQAVKGACDMKGVKHPTLCSESGRALVSHHSVLVFDVFSSSGVNKSHMTQGVSLEMDIGLPANFQSLQTRLVCCARARDYHGALWCAKQLKHECIVQFKEGQLGLSQLARVNDIYDVVCGSVDEFRQVAATSTVSSVPHLAPSWRENGEVDQIYGGNENHQSHNAVYNINLSVFKSMPDTWAIGQLFPVVPIHRLEQEPTVRAILSDLTCDSDGKVAMFIGKDSRKRRMKHLPVHPLEDGKPYYMGMFLGGAYQEALGSLHNLFGTPHIVNVYMEGRNSCKLVKTSEGQTIADVLRLMQHDPASMLDVLKLQIQKSLSQENEGQVLRLIQILSICSFNSCTYLSTNDHNSSVLHQGFLCTSASTGLGSISFSVS